MNSYASVTVIAVVAAMFGGTACATKGFVKNQITAVDQSVETLSQSVEATQEATRKNEVRIAEVDQKTVQAGLWAQDAQKSAVGAQTAAEAAQTKADNVETASKRLVYEVVISEEGGDFKFGSADLPDPVKSRLDELVAHLKADPRGNFLEIEGHTDSIGDKAVNERIGEQRAEAVKRYLYEQYQIPLHKINVISYGMEKPVAPNTTKEGRAHNRRVVIRVLA